MQSKEYSPRLNGNITEKPLVKFANRLTSILLIFCIFSCLLALYLTSTYKYAPVEGPSMFPTINSVNDYDNAYYKVSKDVKKGDIIIVDYMFANKNYRAIKRLIATGGDTICYYNGKIFVNGEALEETYLEDGYNYIKQNPDLLANCNSNTADEWLYSGYETSKNNFDNWCKLLVEGTMSDNAKNSDFFINYNEKYQGSIVKNDVLDTYILTIPEGFVYFLGDNRGQSADSSTLGIAEEKYVVSKVDFISEQYSNIFSILSKELIYLFN